MRISIQQTSTRTKANDFSQPVDNWMGDNCRYEGQAELRVSLACYEFAQILI